MCLTIRSPLHRDPIARKPKPITTTEDFLTWKLLSVENIEDGITGVSNGYEYRAPYRNTLWSLGVEAVAKLGRHGVTVHEGLHSYTGAKRRHPNTKVSVGETNYHWFPAVIPKGSKIFIGCRMDIVSTKLIIYRNMAHLRKARGCSKLSSPSVKANSLHVTR